MYSRTAAILMELLDQSWMLDWSSSLDFRVFRDSLKLQSRVTLEFFFTLIFQSIIPWRSHKVKWPPLAQGGGSFNLLFGLVTVSVHNFFFSTFDG